MAKTSRDAWRHFNAWVDFFGAIEDAVSKEAIEEFVHLRREQKHLRQSFRRFVARGFIKQNSGKWKVTQEGFRFFRRFQRPAFHQKVSEWDGRWRLVSFDVPVKYNQARDDLRALLSEFDFRPLQKSVWVSPRAAEKEFAELMADRDLWKYCKMMVVDILEGDEDLRKLFKLSSRERG